MCVRHAKWLVDEADRWLCLLLRLWVAPDNAGTAAETRHRTWFFFGVSGVAKGDCLTFTLMNMNKQSKLFSMDLRPVFRVGPTPNSPSGGDWDRIKCQCQCQVWKPHLS